LRNFEEMTKNEKKLQIPVDWLLVTCTEQDFSSNPGSAQASSIAFEKCLTVKANARHSHLLSIAPTLCATYYPLDLEHVSP